MVRLSRAPRGVPRGVVFGVLGAFIAVGLSAFAILWLQALAEGRQHGSHSLQVLRTEAVVLSQLEWQAVAEQGVSPELSEQIRETRARARAAFERTLAELGSAWGMPGIESELGRYLSLTVTEFSLIGDGKLAEARRLDEASVDPTFERLTSRIEAAQAAAVRHAERAASMARAGTVFALALGLIAVGVLFWRLASTKQAARKAFCDPLTGLPNRGLLTDRLTQALKLAERTGGRVAVLFLDLENFKRVNDTLGAAAGDTLLRAVADRLLAAGRATDTVARIGGDRFALVLQGVVDEVWAAVAAARLVDELAEPFLIAGQQVSVGASIGCAVSDQGASSSDEMVRNADLAMYASKRQGNRCVVMYEPSMYEALSDRLHLETDLRDALARNEITVAYQPIVEVHTGRLGSMEALVRWTHPVRGVVGPTLFVPLAEETGMIQEIGRFALLEATRQLRRWQTGRTFIPPLSVSVNVSPVQLQDGRIVDDVRAAIRDSGIDPSTLMLEITESVLVERGDNFASTLDELDKLGVRLAIDDFGTGYSSLASLKRFPIDMLKIDRSFLAEVSADGSGLELVRSIVQLGRALGLDVVAEGIETGAQAKILRQLDCDYGQGFHYAQPLTGDAVESYVVSKSSPAGPRFRQHRETDLVPSTTTQPTAT